MDTLNYAEGTRSPSNLDVSSDDEEGNITFLTQPDNVPQLKPVLTLDGQLGTLTGEGSNDAIEDKQKRRFWPPPTRYLMALLACAGCMNSYALRVNLSVAIVAMVRKRSLADESVLSSSPASICEFADEIVTPHNISFVSFASNAENTESLLFNWDEQIQSQILAAFFYGYILTQFVGGLLSSRYGSHNVFGIGILCTALLTLLTPLAAQWSPWALFALRFLEGFGEGVTYPALHTFWSRWAPRQERGSLIGIVYAGNQLGTIIAMVVSGLLAGSRFGWPSIFYVFGAIGVVWCVIWLALTSDSPQSHRFIRKVERDYIVAHTQQNTDNKQLPPVPWRLMLSTPAVLAICVAHFGSNWCLYTFVIELPTYMSKVLNFSLKSNGLLSALPYLAQWVCIVVCGFAADQVVSRTRVSATYVRKIFTVSGLWLPAVFIVLVIFSGCSRALAVMCLVAALAAVGFGYGGFMINHIDVASEYAGTLMALSNSIGTIPGFLVPLAVGQLIDNDSMQSIDAWQWFFYLSVLVLVVCGVFYALFASGERLSWLDDYVAGYYAGSKNGKQSKVFLPEETGIGLIKI